MKSHLFSCLCGLLLIPLMVRGENPPTTEPATTKPVTTSPSTIHVKRGSVALKFDSTGYLEPIEPTEVRLRFKQYAGELTINSIVANGATVAKGDALLVIDPAPLKKLLDSAENELAWATATLEKNEAEYKLSEASEALMLKTQTDGLKDAENALAWWEKVDGPQMLKGWDLQLQQYQHQVDDKSDELEQLKKMYKTEELTSATADIVVKRALRGYEQAKTALEMEKDRIDKDKTLYYPAAKRGVTDGLTKSQQAMALYMVQRESTKAQWKSALFGSRAAHTAAAQKVAELQGDLEKLTVTAAVDGIVWYGQFLNGSWFGGDTKSMRPGEKLALGGVPLTVYAPGKLRVVVDLSEAKYFSVPTGTKATATPTAFPELRVEGKCDAPPRTAMGTQDRGAVYPMKINSGGVDARLIPGMKVSVHLEVPPIEGVLTLPVTAVANGDAWVKDKNGRETKRPVVTGRTDGKVIEIVSGLEDGEEVLVAAKGN